MSGTLTEHHFTSATAATEALADAIIARLRTAIAERGVASLIVSGGKSPVPLFARLRVAALDWSKVWISLADERWVTPTSPDSNERLLREHLLVDAAAAAHFVPLKSAFDGVADGLTASALALAAIPRPFDVVVLGMGEDGHTASLFPGAEGLAAALALDNPAPLAAITPLTAPHARITLTLAALLDSRCVMLPLSGASKNAVYLQLRAMPDALRWPVSAVLTQQQTPVEVWLTP